MTQTIGTIAAELAEIYKIERIDLENKRHLSFRIAPNCDEIEIWTGAAEGTFVTGGPLRISFEEWQKLVTAVSEKLDTRMDLV